MREEGTRRECRVVHLIYHHQSRVSARIKPEGKRMKFSGLPSSENDDTTFLSRCTNFNHLDHGQS